MSGREASSIRASVTAYQGFSIPLEENVIAGAEHCAFDRIGGVKDIWSTYLDAR